MDIVLWDIYILYVLTIPAVHQETETRVITKTWKQDKVLKLKMHETSEEVMRLDRVKNDDNKIIFVYSL